MDLKTELKNFLDAGGKLKKFPKKQKLQILSLHYIAESFEPGREYKEKEINDIITSKHTFDDITMLRRYLVEFGFLNRLVNGSVYWPAKPQPELPKE